MQLEKGGKADKIGNQYEDAWVAEQLLRLCKENILSLIHEPVGDLEPGVDLVIFNIDGSTEFHQCKSSSGKNYNWSLSELESKGILAHAKKHLDADATNIYKLISPARCVALDTLSSRAKNSDDEPITFYEGQIKAIPNTIAPNVQKDFEKFCTAMGMQLADESTSEENVMKINRARDYLRRIEVVVFQGGDNDRLKVIERISDTFITNKPSTSSTVFDILSGYAVKNNRLSSNITVSEINDFLANREIYRLDLSNDSTIYPRIQTLNVEFEESFAPLNDSVILREEVEKVLSNAMHGRSVIVHGKSGAGKSGCILGLIERMKKDGIPYLALKMDRRPPEISAKSYGTNVLDLPTSPVLCLSKIANNKSCVLVLDQLDALRWTAHKTGTALDVCMELIRQVDRHNLDKINGKMSIVFACRTIDLETDRRIKSLFSIKEDTNQTEEKWEKIEIGMLHEDVVREYVGQAYNTLPIKTQNLLRNINHLSIWSKLSDERKHKIYPSTFRLIQEYWLQIIEEARDCGISDVSLKTLKSLFVEKMSKSPKQGVRKTALDNVPEDTINFILSKNIIESAGMLSFVHQSFYDVFYAESLIEKIDNGASISDIVGNQTLQTPVMRYRLQMLLEALSEEDPNLFLEFGKALLEYDDARYYMKHLFWEVVGQLNSADSELLRFIEDSMNTGWFDAVYNNVIVGHDYFIRHFVIIGKFEIWLGSLNQNERSRAFNALYTINTKDGDLVASVLRPIALQVDSTDEEIYRTLCWDISEDTDEMFALRLELLKKHALLRNEYVNVEKLLKNNPRRSAELLYTLVSVDEDAEADYIEDAGKGWRSPLDEIGDIIPVYVWDNFMPLIESKTSEQQDYWDAGLSAWSDNGVSVKLGRRIVCMAISAGKNLAQNSPESFAEYFSKFACSKSLIIREVLVYSMIDLPQSYSNMVIKWLLLDNCKNMFDETGRLLKKLEAAKRLIEKFSKHCDDITFQNVENAIIHYHDEQELYKARCRYERRNEITPENRDKYYVYWGEFQAYILPALCSNRTSEETKQLINVLERRFLGRKKELGKIKSRVTVGSIGNPAIKKDKAEKFTNKQWIRIMSNKKLNDPIFIADVNRRFASIEASPSAFARLYENIGQFNPERFVSMSAIFPNNISAYYVHAVWRLASLKEAPKEYTADVQWQQSSIEATKVSVERFLSHPDIDDIEMCISLCRLVGDRADYSWSLSVINRIIFLATSYKEDNSRWNDESDLRSASLNCIRGSAANALSQLLWADYNRFEILSPVIEKLINDNDPIVRYAILEATTASCNINRTQGTMWSLSLLNSDERIARCYRGRDMLLWLWRDRSEECKLIIDRLITSNDEKSQERGAIVMVAMVIFQYEGVKPFADFLKSGNLSEAHVKGCGEATVNLMEKPEYQASAIPIIHALLSCPYQTAQKQNLPVEKYSQKTH